MPCVGWLAVGWKGKKLVATLALEVDLPRRSGMDARVAALGLVVPLKFRGWWVLKGPRLRPGERWTIPLGGRVGGLDVRGGRGSVGDLVWWSGLLWPWLCRAVLSTFPPGSVLCGRAIRVWVACAPPPLGARVSVVGGTTVSTLESFVPGSLRARSPPMRLLMLA